MNLDKTAITLLLVRLFVGVEMFFAGFEKAIYTSWGGHTAVWSPSGSLLYGGGGILHPWFVSIANGGWVGPLVYTGEMLIGLAILLGLTVRLAALSGIVMNGLFWINAYMPLSAISRSIVDGKIVETRSINTGVFGMGWNTGPLEINAATIMLYIILIIFGAGALKFSIAAYLNKFGKIKNNRVIQFFVN